MQLCTRLDHPEGPLKVGPMINGRAPAADDNFVRLPLADAKQYIRDIAAMYKSGKLTLRDQLLGATTMEDRVLYCAKRSEVVPGLDAVRSIPFVIEVINANGISFVNTIPVSTVKRVGGRTYYGLPYGDIAIENQFPTA